MPESWQLRAACSGHPRPDDFFPDPKDLPGRRQAATLCQPCPVKAECLADANSRREQHGIWGAMARNQFTGEASRIGGLPKQPPTTDVRCGTLGGYSAHRRRNEAPCGLCREADNHERNYRRYGQATR